jgi:glycine cleavage system aminomethyltransferase T
MTARRMEANMNVWRDETTACQNAMEANLEKMELNQKKRKPQWSGRRLLMKR